MFLAALLATAAISPHPPPEQGSGSVAATDYPLEAIQNNWEGEVRVDLTISANGRPVKCTVVRSSRHPVLDKRTCEIFMTRARFKPATDESGSPVESHFPGRIDWKLGR
jgi:protein TonB